MSDHEFLNTVPAGDMERAKEMILELTKELQAATSRGPNHMTVLQLQAVTAERDALRARLRTLPSDEDWDRVLDDYRSVGWVGNDPADWERMFWESGWNSAMRAVGGPQ